jgi:hypothetical protein
LGSNTPKHGACKNGKYKNYIKFLLSSRFYPLELPHI